MSNTCSEEVEEVVQYKQKLIQRGQSKNKLKLLEIYFPREAFEIFLVL